jgi:hypothetical protein
MQRTMMRITKALSMGKIEAVTCGNGRSKSHAREQPHARVSRGHQARKVAAECMPRWKGVLAVALLSMWTVLSLQKVADECWTPSGG